MAVNTKLNLDGVIFAFVMSDAMLVSAEQEFGLILLQQPRPLIVKSACMNSRELD